MGSRSTAFAKTSGPRRAWARGRMALALSLVVHGGLAVLLLRKAPPTSPQPTDGVEIAFDVSEATIETPPLSPAPREEPALAADLPMAAGPSRAKVLGRPGGWTKAGAPATDLATSTNEAASPPADTASDGHASGLATFQPAHPDLHGLHDLHGSVRFSMPEEARRDLLAAPSEKVATRPSDLPKVIQGGSGVTASVTEDGRIHLHDPKGVDLNRSPFQAVGSGVGVGVSGRLDFSDRIMKLAGQDPYASAKRKIAEETREQRLCMTRRYQGEQQKQELFALSTKVRRIAARADLTMAQRRELVFAIWDECAEGSESPADFGAMARATILSVAREAFPEGTSEAYRPSELLALNGRRASGERFDPYAIIPRQRSRHPDGGQPTECP